MLLHGGENGLLELFANEVIESLLKVNCDIILRPHPRTFHLKPDLKACLLDSFGKNKNFQLDLDSNSFDAFYNSDIMISDWSGAALEFSFGLERPVIFVDVPKKILNSKYQELEIEPLEAHIRDQIGIVLPTKDISKIGEIAKELGKSKNDWQTKIAEARNYWVYNIERSGVVAAKFLMNSLQEKDKISFFIGYYPQVNMNDYLIIAFSPIIFLIENYYIFLLNIFNSQGISIILTSISASLLLIPILRVARVKEDLFRQKISLITDEVNNISKLLNGEEKFFCSRSDIYQVSISSNTQYDDWPIFLCNSPGINKRIFIF